MKRYLVKISGLNSIYVTADTVDLVSDKVTGIGFLEFKIQKDLKLKVNADKLEYYAVDGEIESKGR